MSIDDAGSIIDKERTVVKRTGRVSTYDPLEALCGMTCSNVVDGTPIYSDEDHLNKSGVSLLQDSMTASIAKARGST